MPALDIYSPPKPKAAPTGIPGLDDDEPMSDVPSVAAYQKEQLANRAAQQAVAIQRQQAQQSAAQEKRQQAEYDATVQQRRNPTIPQIPGASVKSIGISPAGDRSYTMAPATGEDYVPYDALDPEEQNIVDKIANYQQPFPSRGGLKPDKILRIRGALSSQYPDYDAKEYQSRQSALTGFKSGIQARNITSANTVIGHLGSLMDSATAMQNTGFKPWNIVGNAARSMTGGHPALVDFETKRNAAVTELAALFKGTGAAPTNQEIKEWRESINPNMTPEEMKTAIGAMIELMGSRMSALQEQWDKGVKSQRELPFLTPDSRRTLQRLGIADHAIDPVGAEPPKPPGTVTPPAQPNAVPAPTATPQQPSVRMRTPGGQIILVPAQNVPAAQARGATPL